MKRFLFVLALSGVIGLNDPVTALLKADPPTGQHGQSMQRRATRTLQLQYLRFLPHAYGSSPGKRWPLILFLHGMGERGDNLDLVKKHGPPRIVQQKLDFPFIVISPQCPLGQWWSNDELIALLDEVTEQCQVDPDRVYLTGLSMGGFGSWNLALACPERFAAVVPICGGGNPYLPIGFDDPRAEALRRLPFWAFHGGKDSVVRPEESERMVKALRAFGCQVEFTLYPEAGHDSWTETYNNPKLYDWLLQHRRPASPPKQRRGRAKPSVGKRRDR